MLFAAAAIAFAALPSAPEVAADTGSSTHDARETILLSVRDREHMLAGMRIYLESVQGIITALATNNLKEVGPSARKSGAKLLDTANPALAISLPIGFTTMSVDTHEKFDSLAAKAAAGTSRIEVLNELTLILANCTTCHASYRISIKR
jgi:hypothetical protein